MTLTTGQGVCRSDRPLMAVCSSNGRFLVVHCVGALPTAKGITDPGGMGVCHEPRGRCGVAEGRERWLEALTSERAAVCSSRGGDKHRVTVE